MAKIPNSLDVRRVVPDGRVGIDASNADYGVGQLAGALDNVGARIERVRDRKNRLAADEANAEFLKAKIAQDYAYDDDSDYDTIQKRYGENVNKALQSSASNIKDEKLRNQFELRSQVLIEQGRQRIGTIAFGREKDIKRADINERLNDLRDVAVSGENGIELAIDGVQSLMDNAVELDYYTAEDAGKVVAAWQNNIAVEKIKTMDLDRQEVALKQPWAKNIPASTRKAFEKSISLERKKSLVVSTVDEFIAAGLSIEDVLKKTAKIKDTGLRQSVESRFFTQFARMKSVEQEAQGKLNAELRVGIVDGNVDRPTIDGYYENGDIGYNQWSSLVTTYESQVKKTNAAADAISLINSGVPLDPFNAGHKKAVNAAFQGLEIDKKLVEDFGVGMLAVQGFVEKAGVVPSSAVSVIRGYALNGTPEQKQKGLDAISVLYEKNRDASEAAFKTRDIADGISYAHKLESGFTPTEAVEQITFEREAKDSGTYKVMQRAAKKISDKFDVGDVQKALDQSKLPGGEYPIAGGFEGDAAVVDQYARLFNNYYLVSGDEDLAKKQATAQLRETWGASNVGFEYQGGKNGIKVKTRPRLMAYPPEKYYPHIKEKGWIQKQLIKDVGGKVGRAELVSDSRTAREVQSGLPPTYVIITVDNDGNYSALPQRFVADPRDAEARQKAEQAENNKADLAKAKRKRSIRVADMKRANPRQVERIGRAVPMGVIPLSREEEKTRREAANLARVGGARPPKSDIP